MKEKLSALVDNELSELERRQLWVELARDDGLRVTWGRYHLIRAALHKDIEHIASPELAGRVATAIADVPAHRRRPLAWTIGKAAAGLAIAASVATLAILTMPSLTSLRDDPSTIAKTSLGSTTNVAARSAATNRLNAYLVEHNEFAPTAGMGNMLPYVRTVNYEDNR